MTINSLRQIGLLASVLISLLYLMNGLQLISPSSNLSYYLQFGNLDLNFTLSSTGQLLLVLTVLIWPIAILAS